MIVIGKEDSWESEAKGDFAFHHRSIYNTLIFFSNFVMTRIFQMKERECFSKPYCGK